jgi:hypothetical protein
MTPLVTALVVGAGGLAALVRAQARWDRRPHQDFFQTGGAQDLEPCAYPACGCEWDAVCHAAIPEGSPRVAQITAQDERCAEFARDPDHAERAAAWEDLRDRMFPPSEQHYWVPNGELPGPDGRWWVFLGVTRTAFGFVERDGATAQAERMNRIEKRGKYAALRRSPP